MLASALVGVRKRVVGHQSSKAAELGFGGSKNMREIQWGSGPADPGFGANSHASDDPAELGAE